ncbi:hypothetical protein QBC34DRAFT_461980 [Podospora aff. communis PSN243]|uniref:Uncharacterized protein n=1 Tax=Podospora aff. communis PSN243 TaxID=3040156 RepID=A0AAV9GR25_9PEZI|nr:hypothetical protein QBC34DRAFT_461980 [Podospora aff. communis PSN243]
MDIANDSDSGQPPAVNAGHEGYEAQHGFQTSVNSIVDSKTIQLSIRANYTNWEPREAFRELVQNWRDGIIKSFQLSEEDFRVTREERRTGRMTEIVFKVPNPNPFNNNDLGFIRFSGENGEGTVEITNRRATLQLHNLDLGGTTKAEDGRQAGSHGEGLKVALVVLLRERQNHSVRCCSGGVNWYFNFNTACQLTAHLHRMSCGQIHRHTVRAQAVRENQNSLLPFVPDPGNDVQFVIGEQGQGRNEMGMTVSRQQVKRVDFDAWTEAALFLHAANRNEDVVISTRSGDLLLSPEFRGRIYLKGLLLLESTESRSASVTNLPLKFGYNFASGSTNRERQSLAGPDEEVKAILAIWDNVLRDKPEMASELHGMLNSEEPRYADVFRAMHHIESDTVKRLKDYLLGDQFAGKWYYSSADKSKNSRLNDTIRGLGCEGVELAKEYWAVLVDHGVLHTAEEEEQRRFKAAPSFAFPDNPSKLLLAIRRLLCACMLACPQTNKISIRYVDAGQLLLHLVYDNSAAPTLLIHAGWLTDPQEQLELPPSTTCSDIAFHAVKFLFREALKHLPAGDFADNSGSPHQPDEQRRLQITLAEQKLLEAGISLKWTVNSEWGEDEEVQIHCYLDTLAVLRDTLLLSGTDAMNYYGYCWGMRAPAKAGVLIIDSLTPGNNYFFCLLRLNIPNSFVRVSDVITCPPSSPGLIAPQPCHELFQVGPKLQNLGDVMSVDKEEWYTGKSNMDGKETVIGLLPRGKSKAEEPECGCPDRKRRRGN